MQQGVQAVYELFPKEVMEIAGVKFDNQEGSGEIRKISTSLVDIPKANKLTLIRTGDENDFNSIITLILQDVREKCFLVITDRGYRLYSQR